MNRRALLAAFGLGLVLRLGLCALAPHHGYTWDHLDNIGMGRTAAKVGLLDVYSVTRRDLAKVTGFVPSADGRDSTLERTAVVLPNYPPWALTLFFLQARALDRLVGDVPVNTFVSRALMGSAPFAFELLTAFGLLLLGRRLADERTGFIAAAMFWCAPPVAMNSATWGQVDAFILAPGVFLVLFLIERRWALAGAAAGIAMLLKPQGLILAPIALYGVIVLAQVTRRSGSGEGAVDPTGSGRWASDRSGSGDRAVDEASAQRGPLRGAKALAAGSQLEEISLSPDGSVRHSGGGPRWKPVVSCLMKIAVAAAVVVFVGALPWTLAHGKDWLERCYVQSFALAPDTTSFAFNVWYLDALRLDGRIVFALDSTARLLGLTKDAWGRLLLIAAGVFAGAVCWRRFRAAPSGLVVFAGLWLWSVFMWPTRSHERFIVYCLPFLVLMAVMWRAYRGVLLAVLVLATAEQSWNIWLKGPHAGNLLPRIGTVEWTIRREAEAAHPQGAAGETTRAKPAAAPAHSSDVEAETTRPGGAAAPARELTLAQMAMRLAQTKERLLREAPERLPAYLRARERVAPWDAILTVLSIGAYAWAFVVTLRGPDRPTRRWQTNSGKTQRID